MPQAVISHPSPYWNSNPHISKANIMINLSKLSLEPLIFQKHKKEIKNASLKIHLNLGHTIQRYMKMLFSSVSKYRKIWRIRPRLFDEYRPWIPEPSSCFIKHLFAILNAGSPALTDIFRPKIIYHGYF